MCRLFLFCRFRVRSSSAGPFQRNCCRPTSVLLWTAAPTWVWTLERHPSRYLHSSLRFHFVISEPRVRTNNRVGTKSSKIIAVGRFNSDLHLRPQISLFLDLLKCLCSDLTQDQFVGEDRAGCSSVSGPNGATVRSGRSELWRILRGAPLSLGQHLFALIHFLFPACVKLGHGKFC